MRKLTTATVLISIVLAIPVFGQGHGSPQPTPQPPKGPPTFVEEPIPEGKAVIYIYNPYIEGFVSPPAATILIFSKGELLTLLPSKGYYPLVTDPGTVQLLFVSGSGGQYGSGLIAGKFATEVIAGQAYFLGIVLKGMQVIPAEKAKQDDQILYCRKVE